jgi:hypothetical protein
MRRILICLLILWTLPAWAQQSSVEEIVSLIEPGKWYLGSDVQVAMRDLLTIAQEETQATVVESVNAAVAPYRITVDLMEWELKWWKVGFWAAVAAAAGFSLWAALK